jgi:adenosylhomocysteine nucleosidase
MKNQHLKTWFQQLTPNQIHRAWVRPITDGLGCLMLVLFTGCATSQRLATEGRGGAPLIAVMAAYGPEIAAHETIFLGTNQPVRVTTINGVVFKQVRFEGHDLLLFPSGVSMVNAAMTTQLALERFPISHVLFAGIAGGINPAHQIGDVVIPEKWFHHSEAVYLNPKPDASGYVLPSYFTPPYENFGFMFPDHVSAVRAGLKEPAKQAHFGADPELLAAARRAVPTVPPLVYSGRRAEVAVGGNGIAGPVFMDNREYRQWAFRVWQAECLDMESTAIAQVCWANRKPFLIVRSLSDLAGGQEGVNAADTTEGPVSGHATIVLREVIRQLP